mgnify:CR=1 FL=1
MSWYRFKGNNSDMEVMSNKSFKTLQKVKKDAVVSFEAKLPKRYLDMMSRQVGKHSTNQELLREYLKQISAL